jgi:hypothetical protein
MAEAAPLFESSVPLTVAHLADYDMRTRCGGDRPDMFPLGEGYGILGVPRDGGWSDDEASTDGRHEPSAVTCSIGDNPIVGVFG